MAASTIMLWGNEVDVTPKVGKAIKVDTWGCQIASNLEACEIPLLADFRLPSLIHPGIAYCCNVKVTGSTPQRRPYDDRRWVRVEIAFKDEVGEDVKAKGWMAIN